MNGDSEPVAAMKAAEEALLEAQRTDLFYGVRTGASPIAPWPIAPCNNSGWVKPGTGTAGCGIACFAVKRAWKSLIAGWQNRVDPSQTTRHRVSPAAQSQRDSIIQPCVGAQRLRWVPNPVNPKTLTGFHRLS